jgi:multidrug transporter EmrE-like cation transporter
MMRGLIIVFTAKVAIIMFGRSLYRHHIVAITFIVFGIVVVGSTQLKGEALASDGKH